MKQPASPQNNNKILIALFNHRDAAETAYQAAINIGYNISDINVVMSGTTRDREFADIKPNGSKNPKNASLVLDGIKTGSTTGGLLVGIAAAIGALGSNLLIPGLGLVALGPLAAGLLGAGAGSITGGIIGALLATNVPADKARIFDEEVKKGKIMISIYPHSKADASQLSKMWEETGAEEVYYKE